MYNIYVMYKWGMYMYNVMYNVHVHVYVGLGVVQTVYCYNSPVPF